MDDAAAIDPSAGSGRVDRDPFGELLRRCGVQRQYVDGMGRRRRAPSEAVIAVLRAMHVDVRHSRDAPAALRRLDAARDAELCEPVTVIWDGSPPLLHLGAAAAAATAGPIEVRVEMEDGGTLALQAMPGDLVPGGPAGRALRLPASPPVGIHRVQVEASATGRSGEGTLLVAPPRCFAHEGRTDLAVFLPLHAVRTDCDLGIGSAGDLETLGRWAAEAGARYAGTLPLLATFLDEPFEPSPYVPVSRAVFGELFVDVRAAAEQHELPGLARRLIDPAFEGAAERLRQFDLVDHRESWQLLRGCLEAAAADVAASPTLSAELDAFAAERPLIREYARFRGEHAAPRNPGIDSDAGSDTAAEGHLFLVAQWLLQGQLRHASDALGPDGGLYLDLPIGVHPRGFDAWREPELYAEGVSLGAPADEMFRHGQVWGFPPAIPAVSRRSGHAAFATAVGRHLEHAAALRIDHAAGLFRCFWTPDGFSPDDGVYVHQPAHEFLALLSILSHRHRSTIVAENLGTVPRHVTRGLDRRGLLNMEILQFGLGREPDPLPDPAPRTLVALNTHDMPTFSGHWSGLDIDLHAALGIIDPADASALQADRAAIRERVVDALRGEGRLRDHDREPGVLEVAEALLQRATGTESAGDPDDPDDPVNAGTGADAAILLVNLEDLWGETAPQNVPGTTDEHPNWRRKASRTLVEITEDPRLRELLHRLAPRPVAAGGA